MAYLAAMLNYAVAKFKRPAPSIGSILLPVTALSLQEQFQQPFCDLPVSCQYAEEKVCQYRLAIEILQKRLAAVKLPLAQAQPYLSAAYESLLQAAGTSSTELQQATSVAAQRALATRLRVPVTVLTELQDAYARRNATGSSLSAAEADAERLFGLASTSRDELSTGLNLYTTADSQLKRWNFRGVEAGVNTDTSGFLYLEVLPAAANQPNPLLTVRKQFRSSSSSTVSLSDTVVASGVLVQDASSPRLHRAMLYPQHDSGLKGSVVLRIPDQAPPALQQIEFKVSVVPAITAGRLQVLAQGWQSQDKEARALLRHGNTPAWNGFPFVIDPDVMGPDDIRLLDRTQPYFGSRAYHIWKNRYDFLQNWIPNASQGLRDFIDTLTNPVIYTTSDGLPVDQYSLVPWSSGPYDSSSTGNDILDQIDQDLRSSDAQRQTRATSAIAAIGISREAFLRLHELRAKDTDTLSPEEVNEALDILRQTLKLAFGAGWAMEEVPYPNDPANLANVTVSGRWFQSAIHEPQEGAWVARKGDDQLRTVSLPTPFIDPDAVTPLQLPDPGLGSVALRLWQERKAVLQAKQQAILSSGVAATTAAARADAMLTYAYRVDPTAATALTLPAVFASLEELYGAYQDETAAAHSAATTYFKDTLALRIEETERFLALRAQAVVSSTDSLWNEVASVLVRGWKRAVAYNQDHKLETGASTTVNAASWVNQENADLSVNAVNEINKLITTRKQRLPKWRASAVARTRWVAAVAQAFQRPIIDPDQLVPGDFRQAGEKSLGSTSRYLNAAFEVYARRVTLVNTWYSQVPITAAGIAAELNTTGAELQELYDQRQANVDISAALRRLRLTPAALDVLIDHITAGGPNLGDEVKNILVQVRRERQYAEWAREEITLELYQSPRFFREPQSSTFPIKPWRSSQRERRTWQQSLAARFEQAQATVANQVQAVKNAEDQHLPLLRDALLDSLTINGATTREAKADKLSSQYLIDFKIACCQHTTRVAQGIEVLQKLFFNHRHGLPNTDTGLVLTSAAVGTFDSEWQWLSSYERWRSLMFLYLYPENVLLPTLKPQQTSQFRQIIQEIRQAPVLRPAQASEYVLSYDKYLQDIQTLELVSVAQTSLEGDAQSPFREPSAKQQVSLQIAVAASQRAYSNLYAVEDAVSPDTAAIPSYTWMLVPGIASVKRVVGSAAFQNASGERCIYLFAFLQEEQKKAFSNDTDTPGYLAYQRFNLRSLSWDDDYTQLEIPGEGEIDFDNVLVVGGENETWPPVITGFRNRRSQYLTEFPFPSSAPLFGPLVSFGESDKDALGVINIDLFYGLLDPNGKVLVNVQSKVLFMFSDVLLLSCIRTANENVLYGLGVRLGASNFVFQTLNIRLDSDTSYKYIYSPLLRKPSLSSLFPGALTGSKFDLIDLIIANRSTIISGPIIRSFTTKILEDLWISLANGGVAQRTLVLGNHIAGLGISQAEITNKIRRVGTRLIEIKPFNFLSPSASSRSVYNIYYSIISNNDFTQAFQDRKRITIRLSDGRVYAGSSDTTAFGSINEVITNISETLSFIGPIMRTSMIDNTDVLTINEVKSKKLISGFAITENTVTIIDGTLRTLYQLLPALPSLYSPLTGAALGQRKFALQTIYAASNSVNGSLFVSNLITEAYYALPLHVAIALLKGKYYEEALQYFRLIYDYTKIADPAATSSQRLIYPGLENTATIVDVTAWLANPSNPYAIAKLRKNAHLRFVVISVVRCLLAYADSEFTRDTVESISRGRSLYELATRILRVDVVGDDVQDCRSILDQVDTIVDSAWMAEWEAMKQLLASVNQRNVILSVLQDRTTTTPVGRGIIWLFSQAKADGSWSTQFGRAWQLVNAQLVAFIGRYETLCGTQSQPAILSETPLQRLEQNAGADSTLLDQATLDGIRQALSAQLKNRFENLAAQIKEQTGETDYNWLAERIPTGGTTPAVSYPAALQLQLALNTNRPFVPFLGVGFCVPTNPVPYALLLHAELNLYKIRTCRNIAGVQRELDPYAAPTDTTTGLPAIGANGQLTRTGRLVVPATQYRYAFIIERARQLVSLAQQAEAALLGALEKRDSEAYNLLKARQDIAVSKSTIKLQDLRVNEAEDGIDLAELQLERSELMEEQYAEWLSEGLIGFEQDMLDAIREVGRLSAAQSVLQGIASAANSVAGSELKPAAYLAGAAFLLAGAAGAAVALRSADVQTTQFRATAERRAAEWNFQRNLSAKDIQIGQQQIRLSEDRLRIVGQEKRISELQLDHAEAVLNFLTTKFTNAELYDWMSQVLESAYSYFLQQATATARTAELQLAFERQEVPAGLIQEDYWTPPTDSGSVLDEATSTTDRKGLTGSIRLLQDLTRLDQYAFETNRRKLQLTKTVSLAQAFPTEFVRFRETGVLPFALGQAVFDADFPGQYLRIIRRVRTSVIALVPPAEGIKARLSTAGVSRVVVDGTPFQTLTLPRQPEAVALTSPINATGLFELEQQPGELLYPFEGMGVDVPWTFSMQKAANGNLDFNTIADVLITLEYTALESATYAQQVAQTLGTERQQMVAFSFRNQFADQWYDLHHAAELAAPDQYVARFRIEAADLPANLRDVRLKSLSLYLDLPTDDEFTDRSGLELSLARSGATNSSGTALTNQYGLISTRTGTGNGPIYTGNAAALVPLLGGSPTGDWVLSLGSDVRNRLRARLDQGKVNDIYLILEVEGDVPAYTLV
jgi:hypothetical protein